VDLDAHVRRVTEAYRLRRDAMVRTLRREMPPGVGFSLPSGGLFLWLELPEGTDARVLLRRCLERGVAFVAGGGFFPNGGHSNTARLNFSCMPVERIEEGVRRMAGALRELLSEREAAPLETAAAV
jgi:2-aminoadipate transaminase